MAVKPIPEGYYSITPVIVAEGADALLEFLKKAFGARELMMHRHGDGTIWHSELQIGDSRIMLSESSEEIAATKSAFNLYVEDVDATYHGAIKAGAVSIRELENKFYGDRTAGVRDAAGNDWWMATHVEDVPQEELERRMAAMGSEH
jgi:uncharacterized glyoxalase superfamily protein PhnB